MFNKIRNRAVWQPLIDRYPNGAHTAAESENLVVDVVAGIKEALANEEHCCHIALKLDSKNKRNDKEFKAPPIKGLIIFDGHDTIVKELKVSPTLVEMDDRKIFVGYEHAVMRIVQTFIDEVEGVWDDLWRSN